MKIIVMAGLCLLFYCSLQAEGYIKYVRKQFPVSSETNFYLQSEFSRVVLRQWEKDSVLLEASFRVEGVEEWEKEELAEQVGVMSESWPGTLKIRTALDTNFTCTDRLVVELAVWVPGALIMDLVGRYTSFYLPEYTARKHISLTAVYGDIRIDSLASEESVGVFLNVSYGKLDIRDCSRARIHSSYSSVETRKAGFLQIKAEKSVIEVEAADTLFSEGKYNRYRIRGTSE